MTVYKGERTDDSGKRVYLDDKQNEYVSITTLLSAYEDKSGLTAWSERIGAEEAIRIRDEAAKRGTRTHSEVEAFFNSKHTGIAGVAEFSSHASVAIDKFYSKVEPVREEGVVLWEPYKDVRVAGRFDQLLHIPAETFRYCDTNDYVLPGNVIVDLKTKDKQPRLDKIDYIVKHLMQISSYAKMLMATQNIEIKGGCIVYAVALKTKNCCRILHIDEDCMQFYWDKVLNMLLDYYGIQSMKQTWRDIVKEASCTYDFIVDQFISYEPREIY